MSVDGLLHLVDVGGSGGLEPEWHPYVDRIAATLFEPNPEAAENLRQQGYKAIEVGLSSSDGTKPLYITRNPLCISLQRPNFDFIEPYGLAPHFEIINEIPLVCRRYDSLFASKIVERPDVIKIDTQGHEFDVLLGFGSLLSDCLGIVVETHLYPLYYGERTLCEIVRLLEPFGLVLRNLHKVTENWGGDFVEANAYFTITRQRAKNLSTERMEKFQLLSEIWKLEPYHS